MVLSKVYCVIVTGVTPILVQPDESRIDDRNISSLHDLSAHLV